MERIAPLAKILAEANGIDWQKLHGTGEGGMIVEQDILNYLSRIMSGEEEPPTTPVDAPPPNWDGRDVVPSADMLKGAGVDSDIAAFVEQSRPAPAVPAPATPMTPHLPVTSSSPNLEADALEFELEDETPAPPVAAPPAWEWNAPAPAVSAPSVPEMPSIPQVPSPSVMPSAASMPGVPSSTPSFPSLPDLQVPHVPADQAPSASVSAPVVPPSQHEPAPSSPAIAASAVATGGLGLGSLLSKLYHKEEETPAPATQEVVKEEVAQEVLSSPQVAQGQEQAVPAPATPTEPAAFEPLRTDPVMDTPAPTAEHLPEPSSAPAWTAPAAPEAVQPQVHHDPAVLHVYAAPVAHEHSVAEASAEHHPEEPVAAAAVFPEPVVTAPVDIEPAPVAPQPEVHVQESTPEHEPAAQAQEPEQPAPAVPPAEHPAAQPAEPVWFGTYLRREANLGPASEVRGQLHSALGRELPLAFLVARAAQRHLDLLNLSSVALHDLNAQRARQVQASRLSDALVALDADHDGTPDLLVVDAGQLDLDDLHYPHTATLSVGRVQEGRAALTLNGNLDAEQAARFLAKVGEALEQPLVLVL